MEERTVEVTPKNNKPDANDSPYDKESNFMGEQTDRKTDRRTATNMDQATNASERCRDRTAKCVVFVLNESELRFD